MKFIHAVILEKDEYKTLKAEGQDLTDWGVLCDGDYVVHALYDCEKQCVVICDDDTHNPITAEIKTFIQGVRYCGNKVEVVKAYVVMNEKEDSYSYKQVCEHLTNNDYIEVE